MRQTLRVHSRLRSKGGTRFPREGALARTSLVKKLYPDWLPALEDEATSALNGWMRPFLGEKFSCPWLGKTKPRKLEAFGVGVFRLCEVLRQFVDLDDGDAGRGVYAANLDGVSP